MYNIWSEIEDLKDEQFEIWFECPKCGVECNCMRIIYIDFLFIYKNKHDLYAYSRECVYNIVKKEIMKVPWLDFIESDG